MMNPDLQKLILQQYYGDNGLQYTSGRIPIASCDFSTHSYSYNDHVGDLAQGNFSIAVDLAQKIPLIKSAMAMSSRPLRFFSSPWSAPGWMKTNGIMTGGGKLIDDPRYWSSWALYLSKFLTAYEETGIPIWGITVQNEPNWPSLWDSMTYTPLEEAHFVKNYLGPLLRKEHPLVKIMIHDDQRDVVVEWATSILNDSETAQYVDGIGVHWYAAVDDLFPYWEKLTEVNALFPSKFILPTEACEGYIPGLSGPAIGDWGRGQTYGLDILQDLQNFAVGWTDWNIVLDLEGGPNHAGNFVDAPIILNTTAKNVFYKNPMYYYMGHFSKFIVPGASRIKLVSNSPLGIAPLETTAFVNPDKSIVVVVLNRDYLEGRSFFIQHSSRYINTFIPPASIQTYIFSS
uniref:Glucosylceramidase n=1 Tax=Arcella intermedia TaxID=1963864 RepID=A0A6B2L2T8_9EUKA